MPDRRRRIMRRDLMLIATSLVLILSLLGYLDLDGSDSGAAESQQGRVCFPADRWDGDDAERPCSRIVKVWEDGSTRVRVTQADGSVLWLTSTGSRW